ncbi:hypothetical protein PVNG_06391 [Plasmodium vivax North Korean]|uniref:VIR protein n=1 Tax=Plasmodium vivax North Korean TaxID=1035514 RepID=A0A0J9TKZ0_PLAVI|nr:hypothetical protein PVNG_06391 [Plasmodium vivax North Korean]
MTANETNDTYFNYKDYDTIRGKFLTNLERNKDYDTQFFEKALIELKDKSKREISFRKIFIELQKHLNQDGILGYGDTHNGCKYINYVLNKGIITTNSNIHNETTFYLFKQFEDKFRIHKSRSDHICDLNYISEDIYKKMSALYLFYDKFTSLNPKNTSRPDCSKFSAFVHEFNDSVRQSNYNESIIFKNKLNEFINEIKKYKSATDQVCGVNSSHIISLESDSSVKEKVLSSHNPTQTFQIESISSADPQSVTRDERLLHANGLESPEEQLPREKEQAAETLTHTGLLHYTVRQDNSGLLQPRGVQKSTDLMPTNREQSTLEAESPQQEEYSRNLFPFKRTPYPEVAEYHEVLGSQSIENEKLENKGYLRTVRDAVSGFMEGVDPVPVVGVSGGMGALFLLFRVLQILNLHLCIYNIFI